MAEYTITEALDEVQTRIAQQNKTDKQASADVLLCITGNKYLLADAKFNSISVKNISPTELKSKLNSSKSLVLSDDYTYANVFYVLFKQSVLTRTDPNSVQPPKTPVCRKAPVPLHECNRFLEVI